MCINERILRSTTRPGKKCIFFFHFKTEMKNKIEEEKLLQAKEDALRTHTHTTHFMSFQQDCEKARFLV